MPEQKKMFSPEMMANDQMALLPTGQFANISSIHPSMSVIYPLDQMLPLEFTGLFDEIGTEIFDGDILKSDSGFWIMEWGSLSKGVDLGWGLFSRKQNRRCNLIGLDKMVVVGNIFQNEGLLSP